MTNFFTILGRALKVVGVLTSKLPLYLMDGKLTGQEMADLVVEVSAAAGWTLDITLPQDFGQAIIGVTGDMK